MDVQQLKENTRKLEKDISELLVEFMKENEVAIESVSVDMYGSTTLGDMAIGRHSAIVERVSCKIAF